MKKTIILFPLILVVLATNAQKKKARDKSGKQTQGVTDYQHSTPEADTLSKFTGTIKYYMTTDDVTTKDSMFVHFAEDKIKVTMFYPGYKVEDIFEENMIANFSDSTFVVIDNRKKTYKTEKLGARNAGTEISLSNHRKTGLVMKTTCKEHSGQMILPDGETFDAAALVTSQHSYIKVSDFNFMNIQPVVLGYKIVLGYRTKSDDNENTYILAYKIEKGDPSSHFDLSGYKAL